MKIIRFFAIFLTAACIMSSCDLINNLKGNSGGSSSNDTPSDHSNNDVPDVLDGKSAESLNGDEAINRLLMQLNDLNDKYIEAYNKFENGDLSYATDLEQLENKIEKTGESLANLKRTMTPEQVCYYDSIQIRFMRAVLGNNSNTMEDNPQN